MKITNTRKIGSVELTEGEIKRAFNGGKSFLVTHRQIYEIRISQNTGIEVRPLYRERGRLPLTPRGRFYWVDQSTASRFSGGFILPE